MTYPIGYINIQSSEASSYIFFVVRKSVLIQFDAGNTGKVMIIVIMMSKMSTV